MLEEIILLIIFFVEINLYLLSFKKKRIVGFKVIYKILVKYCLLEFFNKFRV